MSLKAKTKPAIKNHIIRPELNLMRLAHFLFPHPDTLGLNKRRAISYVKKYGETELRSRVVILPSFENQCYTTKTLDVLSALFSVWEDLGRPNPYASFTFSLRDVAKKMGVSFNGEVAKQIMVELDRMSVTTTKWQHAFRTKHAKKIYETVENMHLLWQLKYKSEAKVLKARDEKFFENIKLIEVMFHQKIAENLDSNITIPMNLITYREIKSPIAKVVYNRLNVVLFSEKSHKTSVSAKNIIKSLNLKAKRYEYKSRRKELLLMLIKQLHHKPTSQMHYILDLQLAKTSDNTDYKLLCTLIKIRTSEKERQVNKVLLPVINNKKTIENLAKKILNTVGDKNNTLLYQRFATHYSYEVITRALSNYKELTNWHTKQNKSLKNKQAYFSKVLKEAVLSSGGRWIKSDSVLPKKETNKC